jgi:hypothetical protein
VPVGEWKSLKVAVDKLRLWQSLAGDGQQGLTGIQAGDLTSQGGSQNARSTASAPGVEKPHSRLRSQHRERVLPEGAAERFL